MDFGELRKKFALKVKNFYYFFEDKWYAVLDRIDKRLPVYKVIDPIDRIIPSFVLFLILVLFLLILAGYLVRFASPYEVTFTTLDSATNNALPAVKLSGTLNDEIFENITNSDGQAMLTVQGPARNFFEAVWQLLFPTQEYPFAVVSAEKSGYVSIVKREIAFDSSEYLLSMSPIGEGNGSFSAAEVTLVDAETGSEIADDTKDAYVKFRCKNKVIATKTVKDDADGTVDGSFPLNEPTCAFVLVSAFSPGYEALNVSRELSSGANTVELDRIAAPKEGTAKVYVYEKGSSPKKYLPNIDVVFNGASSTSSDRTDASGVASKALSPGTYTITISDENYYEITPAQNIKIIVADGETSEVEVALEYKPSTANRIVFFKVVDSADRNAIANVKVDIIWAATDGNGAYYGASPNNTTNYAVGNPTVTDSGGLYKRTGFSTRSGAMVAVLSKEGYIYKIFKPALFAPGLGPETILMERATPSNSGSAKITVLAMDTNKPISGASAFLYTDFYLDSNSERIRNIPVLRGGLLTNSSGIAAYTGLPKGGYAASAFLDDAFSGITSAKDLDINQLVLFNIRLNLNVAYLEVVPFDADTGAVIGGANVKVYVVNDADFLDRALAETLSFSSSGGSEKYVSAGYAKKSRLWVSIDANGYAPSAIAIDGVVSPLAPGANRYQVRMRKCAPGAEVDIFFSRDDVYALTDNYWSGISTAALLAKGNSYYARFDAVLCKSTDYSDLLALSRIRGPAGMTNIAIYPPYNRLADLYTAGTGGMDSQPSPHVDAYYLPTGSEYKQGGARNVQSGANWGSAGSALPPGTYPFVVKFAVNADANETDKLFVQFRAKEKHSSGASETPLKEVELDMNRAMINGVFFSVSVNNAAPFVLTDGQSSAQVALMPELPNPMLVRIQNNTSRALTNGTISVYSISGPRSGFSSQMTGNGNVSFDSLDGPKNKDIAAGASAAAYGSTPAYSAGMYPSRYNYTNWVVVEARFAEGTYTAFVNTKASAKTFTLDAEFLAGVMDQNFDGTIYPRSGEAGLAVKTVHLKALRKCNDANVQYETDVPAGQMSGNYFYNVIPGVYEYYADCLKLNIAADSPDNSYAPLSKTIYAGSGGALDASLACVEVTTSAGEEESALDWGAQQQFVVTNKCPLPVTVKVDVGLLCSSQGQACGAGGQEIAVGAARTYTVTGKNIEYKEGAAKPNFTDVLGFYPLYVKARYSSQPNKKLALVDKAAIHLYNSRQCFAISKDSFDFLAAPAGRIDFDIKNGCQYTLIGDYYIPKVALSAFGYGLEYPVGAPSAPMAFNPRIIVTGQQYATTTITTSQSSYWTALVKSADSVRSWSVPGEDWRHYSLSFGLADINYPGTMDKAQFRWIDLKNPLFGRNYPYGARIDGPIAVKYSDGNSYSFAPRTNFSISPSNACTAEGTPLEGEYCEIGDALGEENVGNDNFSFGLMYFRVNPGRVVSIDMNIIGNMDSNNLELRLWPYVTYPLTTLAVVPSGSPSSASSIDAGSFSIYPLEDTTFIVKSIADMNAFRDSAFTSITNPTVYLDSGNPQVLAWIESGYLKARFVGYDITQFNDAVLELGMTRTFGQGIGYGLVTAIDYVSVETAGGKEISGA